MGNNVQAHNQIFNQIQSLRMDQQGSLKRKLFAEHIRQEQRQRIKRQIRQKYIRSINEQLQHRDYYNNYDDNEFQNYRYECKINKFTNDSIYKAINFLFSKNVVLALTVEKNLQFLDEITRRLYSEQRLKAFRGEICHKIKQKLIQLIKYQIMSSHKDQRGNVIKTKQLCELNVLNKCFDGFLSLIEKYPSYIEVWVHFSNLRNQSLKNYSFGFFQKMFLAKCDSFSQEQIDQIIIILENFMEEYSHPNMNKILTMIGVLFQNYKLEQSNTIKLIEILLDYLTEPLLKQKIEVLLQTNLISEIIQFLDRKSLQVYRNNYDVATKVAFFVAKLYSVEDEGLTQRIYMKNVMILNYIRSWLPVEPARHFYGAFGNLTHGSHKCTMYMTFALSNIVASERAMSQTILLKTDIYRVLVYIYKQLPLVCRQQISVFLFNTVNRCDTGSLRVMLEDKLPETLGQMFKQNSSTILKKAMGIIYYSSLMLEEENEENKLLYTLQKFKAELESYGVTRQLDSLVTSLEQRISQLAMRALQKLH